MTVVDTRALIRQLSPMTLTYLEEAAGRCIASSRAEVLPEHLLLAALHHGESDIGRIIASDKVSAESLEQALEASIARVRPSSSDNARPIWSTRLLQAFSEALAIGVAELGIVGLRSGTVLAAVLRRPEQLDQPVLDALGKLDDRTLLERFDHLTAGSLEDTRRPPPQATPEGAASTSCDTRLGPYTQDLREAVRNGQIDPIFGREAELEQLIMILSRRRKNNPVLVGEPGVGKTAVVEGLALAMECGETPPELRAKQLLSLDLGALRAGASVRGELERRLKGVIEAVKASQPPIILFIDEAHTILGAKGGQGGDETADLLKPALARGYMPVIAATTWREYKRDFEKDAALARRFEPVHIEEPDDQQSRMILRGLRQIYEKKHKVPILDEAIDAAVTLGNRYIAGRSQPDKAIDLIDTAASFVRLGRVAPPLVLVRLQARREATARELEALRREHDRCHGDHTDRIESLDHQHTELAGQLEVQQEQWECVRDLVTRLDAALAEGDDPATIADLRNQLEKANRWDSMHEVVDALAVADSVARRTGIPVGNVLNDRAALADMLSDKLRDNIIGQDHAVEATAHGIKAALAGVNDPNAPTAVFLCVGPSGVGKTQLARALAEAAFGGERFLTTVNMGEFQERHTVSRLIGSPPGYVGYGEGGQLTEPVRQRPYSLVLLDEVEKAHRDVLGLFYDVFDRGRLSDGEGRIVDFRNTVLFLTSNLCTDTIMAACSNGSRPDPQTLEDLIRPELEAFFRPALLGRITIVPFYPLATKSIERIAAMRLEQLARRLDSAHGIQLAADHQVLRWLADRATASAGVRAIETMIRRHVHPQLAHAVLTAMSGGTPVKSALLTLEEDRMVVQINTQAPRKTHPFTDNAAIDG
ncbi:MAG: type VI secretion system ATPase TssH [Phycisphaeraceae bacterium]|nr:MAG: type VI secretion system ATPase TssH [Phycisphaeraceae bacterium]